MEAAMKNVLLLVHDDTGQEARFQAALDLVRALSGHLICVDVAIAPTASIGAYGDGGAMLYAAEREQEAQNRKDLEARLRNEGVSWNWIDVGATLSEGVLSAAGLADIIVLNSGNESFPDMRQVASEILMQARKPVLAVPSKLEKLALGRALIAWDGRAACAMTLRASTPLLALAEEVEIFTIEEGGHRTAPEEAAQYLSRHGIHATVHKVEEGEDNIADRIEAEGYRFKADYIVMGAYGRGRLIEIFGGVTRRLLAGETMPLILGH
jgi:nucleotide-binding universal stress UspA family protein